MKCDNCSYKTYEYYGDETVPSCKIFGEEIPEGLDRIDGEGCICNRQTLEKYKRLNDEAFRKENE